jgi:hypothetical protein
MPAPGVLPGAGIVVDSVVACVSVRLRVWNQTIQFITSKEIPVHV